LTRRITFISHAPTSAQRRAAFPLDEPLEEHEFAKLVALHWSAPRAQSVLCGPECRTRQTAEALGLSATVTESLRDCDYGVWRGCELDDLHVGDPDGIAAWMFDPEAAPHGGESIAHMIDRIGEWLGQQGALNDGGHTIAVTHPAVIRSAIVQALGAPARAFWRIDIAPSSLTDLRFNGRAWTLRSSAVELRKTIL